MWSIRAQCWPDSESGRETKYLTVRFVFRVSEVRGLPDGFSWLVKNRLTSVQLKTLNSLMCFSLVQNCWRWLSLAVALVLVGQKRDPDKNRVVLCNCAGFVLLSADRSLLKSNIFLTANWDFVSYGLLRL